MRQFFHTLLLVVLLHSYKEHHSIDLATATYAYIFHYRQHHLADLKYKQIKKCQSCSLINFVQITINVKLKFHTGWPIRVGYSFSSWFPNEIFWINNVSGTQPHSISSNASVPRLWDGLTNINYSQTCVNDHLRIATTCVY